MADNVETLRRLGQHRLDGGIVIEPARQIDEFAVDARRNEVFAWHVLQHVANDSASRHDARIAAEGYGYVGTHQAKNLIIAENGRSEIARAAVGTDLVGTGGIEPPTSSVSRKRSPTELRAFTGEGY